MAAGWVSKSPNIVTSTVLNTARLLPKDLRFELMGAKLASCPGRHITSLRPCSLLRYTHNFLVLPRGVTREGQGGHNSPGAEWLRGLRITSGDAESLRGPPKSLNNVTSTFFNKGHLLPKDLKFEHGGAKLAPCHGRHPNSLCPWCCRAARAFSNTPIASISSHRVVKLIVVELLYSIYCITQWVTVFLFALIS